MNVVAIDAFDLNDAWFQSLDAILRHGALQRVQKGSYEGTWRKQLDFVTLRIRKPGNRPLAPFVPQGIVPPTDEEYIERYATEYLLSPDMAENTVYTYGDRVHEQLLAVIERLKKTPQTNQCCIEIGQPGDFWLDDPPCLRLIQFMVHGVILDMYAYFRSWGCWGGLPTNLGGLQLLKEFVVSETGLTDGEIVAMSAGLHLYDYAWDWAKAMIGLGHDA